MSQNRKFLGVALAGAALGAAVGLLFAPAPGRETRRRLARRIGDEKDDLFRNGHRAVEEVTGYLYDQFEESRKKLAQGVNG